MFVGSEDAKSVLEDEAEALLDWPNMAVPSDPALYKDTELEDLEMGWEDKWPDSAKKNNDVHYYYITFYFEPEYNKSEQSLCMKKSSFKITMLSC